MEEKDPDDEFQVGKERESRDIACYPARRLDPVDEIDPDLHSLGRWPGVGVEEEDDEDSRVETNVPVADGSNRLLVAAMRDVSKDGVSEDEDSPSIREEDRPVLGTKVLEIHISEKVMGSSAVGLTCK